MNRDVVRQNAAVPPTLAPVKPVGNDMSRSLTNAVGVRGLAVLGLLATATLVYAGGRAATPVGVVLEPSFGGLLNPSRVGGTASAAAVLVSLAVLVACWWRVLRLAQGGQVSLRAVGWTGAVWVLPLVVGPPLLSLDAYAYLAQGHMLSAGLDPYSGGPVLLGDDDAVVRMDPTWRASPVPYGPLTLLLLRAVALSHGDLTTGVLLLRLLALLGVLAAVSAAVRLTAERRRPYALALCALNPITLVHLIGGVHVDAVLAGVVGLSLLALRRNRPWLAWTLAACAVAVKVTAAPLLVFVLVALWRQRRSTPRLLLGATAALLLPYVAALPVVHRPWGFLPALTVPGASAPWYAPATMVGNLLAGLGRVLDLPLASAQAHLLGRMVVLLAGAVTVLVLLKAEWADQRPQRTRPTVRRASVALLVVSLCLPAVYGWYLAAGLFGLAAVATPFWAAAVVVLSSALTFSSLPPLYAASRWSLVGAWVIALTVLALGASRRGEPIEPPVEADAARLAGPGLAGPGRVGPGPTGPGRAGPGRRRYLPLAQLAGLALVGPATLGLLSPGANAGIAGAQEQSERSRVVDQLLHDYPHLQLVSVVPSTADGATYDVELVWPGQRTCDLQLARVIGPRTRYARLPSDAFERRVRGAQERPCPPPTITG